jgi:hypothetical protein
MWPMAAGSGASGQERGLSSRCGSVVKAPSSAGTGNRVLTRQSCSPTCRIEYVEVHVRKYYSAGDNPVFNSIRLKCHSIRTQVFPLAEAAEAHRRAETGSVAGRILLAP